MLRATVGPMFAGKSTAILRDSMDIHALNKIVIKPVTDTRNVGFITTHSGVLIPAIEMNPIHGSIRGLLNKKSGITDIFVDEIQFFDPWIIRELRHILFTEYSQINVHVYGLDLDYKLEPWPIMKVILPLADEIIKLTAQCSRCGDAASKTIRTSNLEDQILVGEGNHYEPRCNRHTI